MLKLKTIDQNRPTEIAFDVYVPLKVRFLNPSIIDEPRHSWGIKDITRRSLFEIAIGEISGEIKYFTLVLAPTIETTMPKTQHIQNVVVGCPIFETQLWERENYYTDIIGKFHVYLVDNQLRIAFDSLPVQSKIINERVTFGFDERKILCLIELSTITETEITIFNESVLPPR